MRTEDDLFHPPIRQQSAQAAHDAFLNGILRKEHADRQVLYAHRHPDRRVFGPTALDQRELHPATRLLVCTLRGLTLVNGHVVVQPGERADWHAVRDERDWNPESTRHEVERDAVG